MPTLPTSSVQTGRVLSRCSPLRFYSSPPPSGVQGGWMRLSFHPATNPTLFHLYRDSIAPQLSSCIPTPELATARASSVGHSASWDANTPHGSGEHITSSGTEAEKATMKASPIPDSRGVSVDARDSFFTSSNSHDAELKMRTPSGSRKNGTSRCDYWHLC